MTFKQAIEKYLEAYAKQDECFKEKYDSSKLNKCCSYIFDEVKKLKKENEQCVAMSDDEVYKMARHYYDEQLWNSVIFDIKDNEDDEKVDVKVVEEKKPVKKDKKVNNDQLNMFDFLGE